MRTTDRREGCGTTGRERPARRALRRRAATGLAAGGVAVAAVAIAGALPGSGAGPGRTATLAASTGSPTASSIDTAAIAAKVDPAVVDVNTTLDPLEGGGSAAGTGMILTPNGEIVTNNHVVQGADTITVTVPGHGKHAATVIGTDPVKDVALLDVHGVSGLPTVHFANSRTAAVGTSVVAIGNALGLGGSPTVTTGIISATNRTITASDQTGAHSETLHGLLQTDAPIAPGNSGGPLVNGADGVVGMNTAAASAGTTGASLGFAIPSNTIRQIVGELAHHKKVPGFVYGRQAFLGVEIVDSSSIGSGTNPFGSFGDPFGFGFGFGPIASTPNGAPGVVIAAVDPKSPAARAGLVSGDVITAVSGHATPTTTALSKVVRAHRPGQVLRLEVSTANGTRSVPVRLGKGPID